MDKLEQYLDQLCRSIGGPRSLRQHVRQELREHLLDAVAQHRSAGLSEKEALERALAEFGKPEDVRSELEATHGHRMMAVVIDKAMQWKEMTMRARWLWTTWAHLALMGVIAVQVLTITFSETFLVPKFQVIVRDGWLNLSIHEPDVSWLHSSVHGMDWAANNLTWLLLLLAAAWGLFEWRVRSENKTFMRLSALGTAAVALMVAVMLTTGSMLVLLFLGLPGAVVGGGERIVADLTASVDTSVSAIEQGVPKKDWETMQEYANGALHALDTLARLQTMTPARARQPKMDELRAQLKSATEDLSEAHKAIREKDAARLEAAIQKFHKSYGPVREAARKPAP